MTYGPAPGNEDQEHADVELIGGPETTYLCEPPETMPESRPVRGFTAPGRHRAPLPACTCPWLCPRHPGHGAFPRARAGGNP